MRWRDRSGRLQAKRFRSEEAARAFDEAVRDASPAERSVYSYETERGTRWRYVFRRTNGCWRCGFGPRSC